MKEGLRQQIRAEQVKQLFALTPVGLVANVVNSSILTAVLWKQVVHSVLIGWLLGIVSLTFLRYVLYRLYCSDNLHVKASTWGHWFAVSMAMTGITWGLAGILLFPTESVAHQAFVTFILGGMVAGAAAAFSALTSAFVVYSLPALLPIAVRFFVMGGDIHIAMGTMTLLFGLLMVSTALRIHRMTETSFALRFENRDLIEKLRNEITIREQAEEELQRGRDALESTVQERTADLAIANRELSQEIEERKTAEKERLTLVAQMQHAQKLESLGVLAGGIAHDFNNLLTSVLGNAALALRDLPPVSPARDKMRQIEIAAQRGADLTRQMLAYSGKGRFVVIPLNLNKLVEEMSHLLRTAIPTRTTLKHRFADNLPAIEADAAQVQQVIMNLITNASDALSGKSGLVTISTGMTEVDQAYLMDTHLRGELADGLYVHLEVSDTGAGMDKETRNKIFDPFFTTKTTGRGLGLAAVIGIVRGHKGAIKVNSEPGCGTTVKVLFPASEGQAEAPIPEPAGSETWHGTGAILVVDDEEGVRNVVEYVLKVTGFTVLVACDGREGVDLFRKHSEEIVAVLLDMTMPHMDGATAFAEIHHVRPEVPVILMSGYNEQDATGRFVGKGLAGFIQKPFRPEDVIRKLQQVLGP